MLCIGGACSAGMEDEDEDEDVQTDRPASSGLQLTTPPASVELSGVIDRRIVRLRNVELQQQQQLLQTAGCSVCMLTFPPCRHKPAVSMTPAAAGVSIEGRALSTTRPSADASRLTLVC